MNNFIFYLPVYCFQKDCYQYSHVIYLNPLKQHPNFGLTLQMPIFPTAHLCNSKNNKLIRITGDVLDVFRISELIFYISQF